MNNDYNRIMSDTNADSRQARSDSAHQAAIEQQTRQMIRAMREMKEQEKVDMLKLEMAKTTDPQIQMQLQHLIDETLESIATRKRRELIGGTIMVVILAVVAFFAYQFFYSPSAANNAAIENNADPANILPVAATTNESNINESTEESITVDTMNLTDQQAIDWITAVQDEFYSLTGDTDINYYVNLYIYQHDNLLHGEIKNSDVQMDNIGLYRVNEWGELEKLYLTIEDGYPGEWRVISEEYLDTSKVHEWVSELRNQSAQTTNNTDNEITTNQIESTPSTARSKHLDLDHLLRRDWVIYHANKKHGTNYSGNEDNVYFDYNTSSPELLNPHMTITVTTDEFTENYVIDSRGYLLQNNEIISTAYDVE